MIVPEWEARIGITVSSSFQEVKLILENVDPWLARHGLNKLRLCEILRGGKGQTGRLMPNFFNLKRRVLG